MSALDPTIVTMGPADEDRILEICEVLVRSFRDLSPTWVPTVEAAHEKVIDALQPGMLNRALLIGSRVAGWVGARPAYGAVWELHPLVVDEAMRGRGFGRLLVTDIESLVGREGALTLLLGTSDEMGRTTLADQDLFRDPIAALRDLKVQGSHPLWLLAAPWLHGRRSRSRCRRAGQTNHPSCETRWREWMAS